MSTRTRTGSTRLSRRSVVAAAVVALLVLGSLSLAAGGVLADEPETTDEGIYTVDDGHGLATSSALSEYRSSGYASGELDGLDATISVAESKSDVDREGFRPLDVGHDYVRLEYREDIARTLRIRIPQEYATPYPRDAVESLSGEHVAEYEPVRGGEYLQIVIRVEGPTDVVLPIHAHSAVTYSVIASYEDRFAAVTGGDREWLYLDRHALADEHVVEISVEDANDVVVHHDARPDEPEEVWINTPRGSEGPDGVYWYAPDSEGGESIYVVTKGDDVPDVRVMDGGGYREELEGHTNDAKQIPDRIRDGVADGLGGLL